MNTRTLLFVLLLSLQAFAAVPQFPNDKSCVAWETFKRMFLVSNQTVQGINCDLTITVDKKEKLRTVKILIPVNKFDSQQSSRDKEVADVILAKQDIEIIIADLTEDQWAKALKAELMSVPATITVKGTVQSFDLQLVWSERKVNTTINTQFTKFNLEPPTVVGGVVAKVRDELNLYASINISDIAK